MTALRVSTLSEPIRAEMARLKAPGHHLLPLGGGADAIALLVLLEAQHGHAPGKRFPLDFDAMRGAGLLNLSKPRLRAARRTLEGAGLLRLVGRHRAGSAPQTFALTRSHSGIGSAVNVQSMPSASGDEVRGKQGGGASLTYDARFQTYKCKGGQ